MKKKTYKRLSMKVVELKQRTRLLQTSEKEPKNVQGYDDWLG